jgi:hypothetical protein
MKTPEEIVRQTPDFETQWELPLMYHPVKNKWQGFPLLILGIIFLLMSVVSAFSFSKERELLDYIEKETGMETSNIVPRYEYWPIDRMNKVFYAEHYSGQENVLALTIEGLIILPPDFDENKQPEVLLHELFHLAVWENGVKYQCIGAEEQHAYRIQEKYVKEVLDGNGMIPDPFMVFLMQCHLLIPR